MKNISELSIIELKAMAYDHLASIEASQRSIQLINAELLKRTKKEENPKS